MKKLPKEIYVQRASYDTDLIIADFDIAGVADTNDNYPVNSNVGIYVLKEERKLIRGVPKLVRVSKK